MPLRANEVVGSWGLALDVAEQGDVFTVKASLPGISADDLNVTLEDNVLTIQGEVKEDETIEEGTYHIRERRTGSFSRSVRFPVPVEAGNVVAAFIRSLARGSRRWSRPILAQFDKLRYGGTILENRATPMSRSRRQCSPE